MNKSRTWNNYSLFAKARGNLVLHLVEKVTTVDKKRILDIGCGEGGTAFILASKGAHVKAIDINDTFQYTHPDIEFRVQPVTDITFENEKFDIVILQDVVEHLPRQGSIFPMVYSMLNENGIILVTTPNRLSPFNFIADPHWNLPFVSLFSRRYVKLFVKYIFRKDRRERSDWAALFSLFQLKKRLLSAGFVFHFMNKEVAQYMFNQPESVVCNPVHLKLVEFAGKIYLDKLIVRIVNNNEGFFNYFINPTWYIVAKKAV